MRLAGCGSLRRGFFLGKFLTGRRGWKFCSWGFPGSRLIRGICIRWRVQERPLADPPRPSEHRREIPPLRAPTRSPRKAIRGEQERTRKKKSARSGRNDVQGSRVGSSRSVVSVGIACFARNELVYHFLVGNEN